MPRGTYPVYINSIPSGIVLKIESLKLPLIHTLCSLSQTASRHASSVSRTWMSTLSGTQGSATVMRSVTSTATVSERATWSNRDEAVSQTRMVAYTMSSTFSRPLTKGTARMESMSSSLRSITLFSVSASVSLTNDTGRQQLLLSLTTSSSKSPSMSHWKAFAGTLMLSLEELSSVSLAAVANASSFLFARVTNGVIVVLRSNLIRVEPSSSRNETLAAAITTLAITRSVVNDAPTFVFNMSFNAPSSGIEHLVVRRVTVKGESVHFTQETTTNVPWCTVFLPPPPGVQWFDASISMFSATSINATILLEYNGDGKLLLTVTIPLPSASRDIPSKVAAAVRYSQLASLVGGVTSGAALGRIMATRSIALCTLDTLTNGGLIDVGFRICALSISDESPHQAALASARSAIASNFMLLIVVSSIALCVVMFWGVMVRKSLRSAACALCLPSSLLPLCIAVTPSSISSAIVLFAFHTEDSPTCNGVDVIVGLLGLVVGIAPAVLLSVCWWCKVRVGTWQCSLKSDRILTRQSATELEKQYCGFPFFQRHLGFFLDRRYVWTTLTSKEPLAPMWPVLLEYRDLRYATLDNAVLIAVACTGTLGGLSGSEVACRGWGVVSLALFVVQLVFLIVSRPFSTHFSTGHGAATLALTIVGVMGQLVFVFTSATTDTDLWLIAVSSICSIIVVGLTVVKMMMDVGEVLRAVRRRLVTLRALLRLRLEQELKRQVPICIAQDHLSHLSDSCSEALHESFLERRPIEGLGFVETLEIETISDGDTGGFGAADDFRFWDSSGVAKGVEAEPSLLLAWHAD